MNSAPSSKPRRVAAAARGKSAPVRSSVKSADRVLDLLELLASTGRAMTHAEISRRTGVPKSSLSALLRNLVERGYIEQLQDTQQFQLGEGAYALARRGAHNRDLLRASEPWLQRLMRDTEESAGLSVLRNDMAERIASAQSPNAVLYSVHVGVMQPLYASSAGKVLLAWLPPAEREAYLQRVKLQPRTEQTIRSTTVLRRQLNQIREEGVAWSFSEFTVGIVGLAVPILDVHGRALAALGLALPASRLDDTRKRKLELALRAAAAEIAAATDRSRPIETKSVHI
ncbi:IclR family transcriptional regulator [Pigmentiphaga sp. GD03639]|uniref:IclR family transcriptional regulator n=1 Tax=unclassified Pigmentiphaga TaxID=2626614 RepID=UPI00244A6071|nr:IclR family transcriptional regulator [Pigmentiphaga sp. GD03639]MDH2240000.1 IclR family transcriptional regulator [Pigmentiphaga sp. GD03639]